MMQPRLSNISVNGNSIGKFFLLITLICIGACSPMHSSYSNFVDIEDNVWDRTIPCEFVPVYSDTLSSYDVKVAFCYEHKYPFRNVSLVVDFMKNDSLVNRVNADFDVADANGSKQSAGFGVAYQAEEVIAKGVNVVDFDKIRVWNGIENDTLNYITSVGVIIIPTK